MSSSRRRAVHEDDDVGDDQLNLQQQIQLLQEQLLESQEQLRLQQLKDTANTRRVSLSPADLRPTAIEDRPDQLGSFTIHKVYKPCSCRAADTYSDDKFSGTGKAPAAGLALLPVSYTHLRAHET